ncbi:protein hobbit [Planococcus citri]|uniref:protein hobbit n=1 Tax=Planococcus citri TaxID=170843 RepID=UPI0031F84FA6
MNMDSLIVYTIAACVFYGTIAWVLPKVLSWIIKRKYHIEAQIGRISFPYFTLHDVLIKKNGFSIHIDKIGFRSSFLSSEVSKLLCLVICDVRVNKDVTSNSSDDFDQQVESVLRRNDISFHNQKIPPVIITFAQFLAIHIRSITAMLLRPESPEWLLHASANDVQLDGSLVRSARTLLVNVTMTSASAKLLRHAPTSVGTRPTNPIKTQFATCLAEVSVSLGMELTLLAQGPFSVEKLCIALENMKAVINDGFYGFVEQRYQNITGVPNRNISAKRFTDISEAYELLHNLSPIIPKIALLKMKKSILTGMKDNINTEMNAMFQKFQIKTCFIPNISAYREFNEKSSWPHLAVDVMIDGVDIRSSKEKILNLQELKFDAKMEKKFMAVSASLNTFSFLYNHKEIHHWLTTNFGYLSSTNSTNTSSPLKKKNTLGKRWFDYFNIQIEIQLCNVTTLIKLSSDFLLGFNNVKFLLNCDTVCDDERGDVFNTNKYYSQLPLNLRQKNWSCEFQLDSIWADLNYDHGVVGLPQFQKYHYWGTPLWLGAALIKMKGCLPPKTPRLQVMFDNVQLEWSPPLSSFLNQVYSCCCDYRLVKMPVTKDKSKLRLENPDAISAVACSVSVANVNLFLIADKKICIAVRIDSISFMSDASKLSSAFEGVKMASIIPTKHHFVCVKSEDVKNACFSLKSAIFEWRNQNKKIELTDEIDFCWSTNLHLKLLTLYSDMKETYYRIAGPSEIKHFNNEENTTQPSASYLKITVRGKCRIGVKISSNQQILFSSESIVLRKNVSQLRLECPSFRIAVDNHNIFTVDGFLLIRLLDSEILKAERSNAEGFVLATNTVWEVNISSLKAVFPYEHNFCVTFHSEFLTIVKWLRLLHKKSKNANKMLPGDIIFKVKDFLFEMSDDPFEVSLRDNYELLADEYEESIKREKMLDERLAKMYKEKPFLPAGKVEELHASLQKINAQIYVQRSKQMKLQAPIRTRLFAWLITDLEINFMADPSIMGNENVVRILAEIDPESPWPIDGIEFTTLWCRFIAASCKEWKFQLRDFPQPWVDIGELHLWGKLVGAEQEATKRAKRDAVIELGDPYGEVTIERSMTSLKYYHDFNCEVDRFSYAFGPCWEPVISQCNLAFSKIISSSKDPSPPLPFWDKIRLIYHGRLTMCIRQLTFLLHASLDPYNTTEEMEVTWNDLVMDWTNAKFIFKGNLEVYVRTASKYDDCRLLYLPNLKLTMKLKWNCNGDINDHHSVMPCAPDKLPEYSSNQEHDSFRAFRSQNVNLTLNLETKPSGNAIRASECPVASLFSSTLRWFESLKLILSGVTRPTRRGLVFNNLRPRKLSLNRHYKKVNLYFSLHRFQVHYWMSFSRQRGLELVGQKFTFGSEYSLNLVAIDDGLRHRPRAMWSISYMNCELNDAEVWLKSALQIEDKKEQTLHLQQPVEKCYFLSVSKVRYGREPALPNSLASFGPNRQTSKDDTPTHRLEVVLLKGAWTPRNRDIIFALYDSFRKTQQLKKNLSTAALKGFRCPDSSTTPIKTRSRSIESQVPPGSPIQPQNPSVMVQETPSPMSKLQSGHAASMLQQLIAEAENKAVVFSDDLSVQMREQYLQGLASCQEDDVVHKNWSINLVNSQVLLKGCETKGYVIMSTAKAEILKKIHRPVWKDRTLVSKTSWVGSLECMQYYATVSANDTLDENIMWLSVDNIQEKEAGSTVIADLPDLPHLVGSGQSVGGVVSETVGAGGNVNENSPLQLQRIVSRCKCEFFYAGYGETSLDPSILDEVPPPPAEDSGTPWERQDKAVDAFTLMHHDLDVCTNSLQYAMILDIVNNLLLYVEPRRKEAYERLQRMRFQLQLQSVQDQRKPIQQLQNLIRSLVAKLKRLEKEIYLVQKTIIEENSVDLFSEIEHLEREINECKEQLNSNSEELDMMLSCYKETQLMASQKVDTLRGDKQIMAVRTSEICFKHAQWRLTEADGQLGIADLVLSNFLYTKVSKNDDSVEHLLELGYIRMTNLLANEPYKEVIFPTEIQSNMPVARKRAVRMFCREKAPVGGISVKEHFEINVVPFTIGLSKKFYDTMLKFCFPERDTDNIEGDASEDSESSGSSGGNPSKRKLNSNEKQKKWKETNFYVPMIMKDDVEKMKERAEKNKLFIYIKIPEVPVRVSYKGNKEKNIEDIRDFSLVIPTLEYHNVTWTWLDLFLAMKNDSKHVILPQAIKQKLQIKVRTGSCEEGSSPQEEDKAKLLFGTRVMPNEPKGTKKTGIFKLPK